MYVIRNQETGHILHIDYSEGAEKKSGEELYPDFDVDTMELGWTEETYIPAYFDIDKKGKLIELSLAEAAKQGLYELPPEQKLVKGEIIDKEEDELIKEGILELDKIKQDMLDSLSQAALELRSKLIPDYKLNNVALGLYDDERIADYRATVEAFREEYHRLEGLVEKAKNYKDLVSMEPKFPEKIIKAK